MGRSGSGRAAWRRRGRGSTCRRSFFSTPGPIFWLLGYTCPWPGLQAKYVTSLQAHTPSYHTPPFSRWLLDDDDDDDARVQIWIQPYSTLRAPYRVFGKEMTTPIVHYDPGIVHGKPTPAPPPSQSLPAGIPKGDPYGSGLAPTSPTSHNPSPLLPLESLPLLK